MAAEPEPSMLCGFPPILALQLKSSHIPSFFHLWNLSKNEKFAQTPAGTTPVSVTIFGYSHKHPPRIFSYFIEEQSLKHSALYSQFLSKKKKHKHLSKEFLSQLIYLDIIHKFV